MASRRVLALVLTAIGASLSAQSPSPSQEAKASEIAFVSGLDKAWSKSASAVMAKFDFVHRGVERELRHWLSEKHERRTSKILRSFETKRSDGRVQRALFVKSDIVVDGRPQEHFEILVFHPSGKGKSSKQPKGLLLLRTTQSDQFHVVMGKEHVGSMSRNEKLKRSTPIGRDLHSYCPACNFSVGAPSKGNWAVVARGPMYRNCERTVEVYSLDEDILLSLRVDPRLEKRGIPIRTILATAAKGVGNAHRKTVKPKIVESELAGLKAHATQLEFGKRGYRLWALRRGPVDYMLSLQGPSARIDPSKNALVRDLISTFRPIEASQPDAEFISRAYLKGRVDENGDFVFSDKKSGVSLRLRGPKGWKPHADLDGLFYASWTCPKGARLAIRGQASPECKSSTRLAQRQIKRSMTMFRRRVPNVQLSKIEEFKISGREACLQRFSYKRKEGKQTMRGFVLYLALPHMVVQMQGTLPGASKKELEQLVKRAKSLEIR